MPAVRIPRHALAAASIGKERTDKREQAARESARIDKFEDRGKRARAVRQRGFFLSTSTLPKLGVVPCLFGVFYGLI